MGGLTRKTTIYLVLCLIIINGCGHQYNYNNKSYSTAKLAHKAHLEDLKDIESKLQPFSTNLLKNAIIITPSQKTTEALGVTRTGHPPQELVFYAGKYLGDDYSYFANFLRKSNLFASVEHRIDDFPKNYANKVKAEYAATIYFDMKSPTQMSWFVTTPPENIAKPFDFDKMAEAGAPKIQSWINNLKKNIEN